MHRSIEWFALAALLALAPAACGGKAEQRALSGDGDGHGVVGDGDGANGDGDGDGAGADGDGDEQQPIAGTGGGSPCGYVIALDWCFEIQSFPPIERGEACVLPLDRAPASVYELNLSVDCELISSVDAGGAGGVGGWTLDTSTVPPEVHLHGEICDQVESGYDVIEVVYGCRGPL